MKRTTAAFLISTIGLFGCASSGTVKQQQADIAKLQSQASALQAEAKDKDAKRAALESAKAEAEGKAADLAQKLADAQARIDSLAKSNQDLSKASASSAGQLSAKIKEVIAEKDELGRKLIEAQKEKISAGRAKTVLQGKREKALAELADLSEKLEAVKAEKEAQEKRRSALLAKVHDDMGTVADAVLKEIQSEKAAIAQSGADIVLTLQEPLLFEPQQAKVTEAGAALLDRIGAILHGFPARMVRVQGHSDNSPIKWELFGRFTSHWDLSSARATAVARYLHEHSGLDPRYFTAEGYGEFRPAKSNDSAQNKAANRRIVLIVEPPRS